VIRTPILKRHTCTCGTLDCPSTCACGKVPLGKHQGQAGRAGQSGGRQRENVKRFCRAGEGREAGMLNISTNVRFLEEGKKFTTKDTNSTKEMRKRKINIACIRYQVVLAESTQPCNLVQRRPNTLTPEWMRAAEKVVRVGERKGKWARNNLSSREFCCIVININSESCRFAQNPFRDIIQTDHKMLALHY
jgi:hypothetical protein